MRVEFLGFKDEVIPVNAANTVDTHLVLTAAYIKAACKVTAPAGAKKMRISFITSSGVVNIDDVEIRMVRRTM